MSAVVLSCERCQNGLEPDDLRCAVCGLPSPDAAQRALDRPRVTAVRCPTCGAGMRYAVEGGAPRCAFCGSETKLETQADPVEEAEATVPFAVSPLEAKNALQRWLATRGFFRPKGLAAEAIVETIRPLLWPAWICAARALASWTADSDAGAHRSEWAPHAGQVEMDFRDLLIPASRGLTLSECRALTPRFDLARAVAEQVESPPGTVAERFEATRSAARRIVLGALEGEATRRLTSGHVPGRRFRNVKVELLLRGLRSRRMALPSYVLAYRYRDKLYRVLVHGQDAGHVIGKAPLSVWRVLLVSVGGAALIAAIVAIVLLLTGKF